MGNKTDKDMADPNSGSVGGDGTPDKKTDSAGGEGKLGKGAGSAGGEDTPYKVTDSVGEDGKLDKGAGSVDHRDGTPDKVTGSASDNVLEDLARGSTSDDSLADLMSGSTSEGDVVIGASGGTPNLMHLKLAIHEATTAVELDKKHDYEGAVKFYYQCAGNFVNAIKYEAHSEKVKETIRQKCAQYLDRCETIANYLKKRQKKAILRAMSAQESYEGDDLLTAITREKPSLKWDDVVDIAGVKTMLEKEVLFPIKFPHMFTGSRKAADSFILYGVPGCGKSYLVRSICSKIGASYFFCSCSDLISKYIPAKNKRKLVRKLFHEAWEKRPSIVFLDDIDLLESVDEVKDWVINELNLEGVVFITTTSVPWKLNSYWWRVLKMRLYVPLPTAAERSSLFRSHLGSSNHSLTDEDFKEIGEKCEGYSPSDVAVAVKDSLMMPLRAVQNATHFKKVSGPSPTDSTVTVDDLLTPCNPGDQNAIEMNWTNLPADKLFERPVTKRYVLMSLEDTKCSIPRDYVTKMEQFRDRFQ